MSRQEGPCLRIVGGNDKLVTMNRVGHEARWPPLRVVGVDYVQPAPAVAAPRSSPVRSLWSVVLGLLLFVN